VLKLRLVGVALGAMLALHAEAGVCAKVPIVLSGERYDSSQKIAESYNLGAGDKIRVAVFGEPQLSGDYQIATDGSVALPLVGSLGILGKTPSEVASAYEQLLGRDYLRFPRVSVEVIQYRPFFIVGQVRMPGQYSYLAGLTVWNAIAMSQGLTPRGRDTYVFIRKYGEMKEQKYRLVGDLRVWPGDTIRVAERFF